MSKNPVTDVLIRWIRWFTEVASKKRNRSKGSSKEHGFRILFKGGQWRNACAFGPDRDECKALLRKKYSNIETIIDR